MSQFSKAAANAFFDRYVHVDPAHILGGGCPLSPPVLRFALTRDRSHLPNTYGERNVFAARFIIANSDSATVAKLSKSWENRLTDYTISLGNIMHVIRSSRVDFPSAELTALQEQFRYQLTRFSSEKGKDIFRSGGFQRTGST